VKKKNRALKEIARTLLSETNLPKYFWADAINTACYVLNRVLVRPILKKTLMILEPVLIRVLLSVL